MSTNMRPKDDIKIAAALGGGFFRGIAHIGFLQVMKENDIPIDIVTGTSIGSVVGSIYATGMDLYRMEQFVSTLTERMLFDMTVPRQGFMKGEKILTFVRTLTGNKTFEQTNIPFACVACDIETGERVVLDKQLHLCDAVRASISVPGVFEPYRIGERLLVDGGLKERVPVTTAYEMGADFVIGCDVGVREGVFPVNGIMEIMLRTLEIMETNTISLGRDADVVVMPNVRDISMMSLNQSADCLDRGRKAAQAQIEEIKAAIEKAREKKAQRKAE
ncbi:MAG: patatin family protein [Clostridiales bacterium]|nr:patatin family protein [Clostridiales bacterium]MBQ2816580.1 patatin-like phospholipase family protein [Clostridia bacterium]